MPSFEPIRIDTTVEPPKVEKIVLFYIDDTPYEIPARIQPNVALGALRVIAEDGYIAGINFMLMRSVGETALRALEACQHVTGAQIQELLGQVKDMYFGQFQELTKN